MMDEDVLATTLRKEAKQLEEMLRRDHMKDELLKDRPKFDVTTSVGNAAEFIWNMSDDRYKKPIRTKLEWCASNHYLPSNHPPPHSHSRTHTLTHTQTRAHTHTRSANCGKRAAKKGHPKCSRCPMCLCVCAHARAQLRALVHARAFVRVCVRVCHCACVCM